VGKGFGGGFGGGNVVLEEGKRALLIFCVLERSSLHSDRLHPGLVFWIGSGQSGRRMCSE
jgi:hypothetical protein